MQIYTIHINVVSYGLPLPNMKTSAMTSQVMTSYQNFIIQVILSKFQVHFTQLGEGGQRWTLP